MENKINIAELLRNCPKGMQLYSPLCGECYFDRLHMGTIICKKQNTQEITFTSKGYYMLPVFDDCECVLFPSKENRDWNKFRFELYSQNKLQRPFKNGDVIYTENFIAIFSHITEDGEVCYHCYYYINTKKFKAKRDFGIGNINYDEFRIATEEEKEKLFQAIKDNGYRWNTKTKTLEKVIKPKFKVGDRIKHIVGREEVATVVSVEDLHYNLDSKVGTSSFSISLQREWELVPNKFDITTLKPFESKVLVRDYDYQYWRVSFFGYFDKFMGKFDTVRGVCIQCIPYEGNEHLIGKTDDCDEYFKNW